MKIGIFGDSYGLIQTHWNKTLSWVDIISNEYSVDNYSVGASSLYFSYLKFKEFNHLYDKIVFCVTNPGRLYLPHAVPHMHISHFNSAEHYSKTAEQHKSREIYTAAKDYFLHVQNDQFDQCVHNLLVEDIKRNHSQILLVPCFQNSLAGYTNNLFKACQLDWNYYKLPPNKFLMIDKRHGHMNIRNNRLLANSVLEWIQFNTFHFENINWEIDTEHTVDFYFENYQ